MKKLLASAAFVAMAAAVGPAFADSSVSSTVELTGTATDTCTVTVSGTTNTIGSDWTISGLVTDDSVNTAAVNDLNIGTVSCNYGATAGLKTLNGGMTGPTAALNFDNSINYKATLDWGTLTGPILLTNGTPNTAANSSDSAPRVGQVALKIEPQANINPLVSGVYTDTLTVQIGTPL